MSIFPQGFKYWNAIEADTRRLTFAEAGELSLGDPLYLLSKQWRMGEFRHLQGGLPIRAEATIVEIPLTATTDAQGTSEVLEPGSRTDEALAEPSMLSRADAPNRSSLRLGLSASRHIREAVAREPNLKSAQRKIEDSFSLGSESNQRVVRLRSKSGVSTFDGGALYAAIRDRDPELSHSPLWPALVDWFLAEGGNLRSPTRFDPMGWAGFNYVFRFDDWFRGRMPPIRVPPIAFPFPRPDAETESDQLSPVPEADLFESESFSHTGEIIFGGQGGIRLTVEGSLDGTLNWTMVEGDVNWPDTASRGDWVVPARLSFPGKPEDRLWTLADTAADWTAASAGPSDLSRMVLGALIAEQSSDWTIIPLTVARGGIVRITGLWMVTGFGRSIKINAADPGHLRLWASLIDQSADTVFTLAEPEPLEGPVGERAVLRPDDHANRLWLIERRLPDVNGRGRDQAENREPLPVTDRPVYHLQVDPGENWYPFSHREDGTFTPAPFATSPGELKSPKGKIGASIKTIAPGLVPADGLAVERVSRRGRDHAGFPVSWIARRRVSADEPASSGLMYDHLVRPGRK